MNYNTKVHPINLDFHGKVFEIFTFLVETSIGPIIIETGPHSSFENLVKGIEKCGYQKEDIKHVFLTHVHLDHGGGAWCWAELGAKIYVHPEGYRHIHNPEKLLASAKRIYGDMMDWLWGTLKPIPATHLQIVEDNEIIQIGDCEFKSIHSPGHAKHHTAWQLGNVLFTGDVAGVRIENGPILPPCPPPDIDIEMWEASINKCLEIKGVDTYYLTHGSKVEDIHYHMEKLKALLWAQANFIKPYFDSQTSINEIFKPFQKFIQEDLITQGVSEQDLPRYENANPTSSNIYGLMRYWKVKSELVK